VLRSGQLQLPEDLDGDAEAPPAEKEVPADPDRAWQLLTQNWFGLMIPA
jgi:hypothetical protein